MNKAIAWIILFGAYCDSTGCKRPYAPPAIQTENKFLVVDGMLLNSIDSPSIITLSRTIKLSDTINSFPEPGAIVSVEGNTGDNFAFAEQPNGVYKLDHTLLNNSAMYRLKIKTANGSEYASDYVEVKQDPPIDSITWRQQNDVKIFANTHDPLNNTKYYQWNFVETWQYRSELQRSIAQQNGLIYYIDSTNQTYNCWSHSNSSAIITASSVALSKDEISEAPIATIPQNSEKIGIRYSILVKQYALTQAAYQYLQILQKNTEELGSLFDTQPTELIGNIHSASNLAEIVIGFFSASSVQQKRIFINHNEVTDWTPVNTGRACDIIKLPEDPGNSLLYNYSDPEFAPYYFSTMPPLLIITRKSCVDCTLRGGSVIKPSFW